MLTLSLSRAERWKTSWIKAILWNSKNINKVDPFSPLALLSRKQSMRLFFIPSTVFSVLIPPLLPASRSSAWCDGRQKFSVRREIYAPTIVYCGVKPTSSSRVASAYVKARYIGSCTTVITSSTKALDEASRCALPWWKLEEEEEARKSSSLWTKHIPFHVGADDCRKCYCHVDRAHTRSLHVVNGFHAAITTHFPRIACRFITT